MREAAKKTSLNKPGAPFERNGAVRSLEMAENTISCH